MTTTTTEAQLAVARSQRLHESHQAYLSEVRELAPTWLDVSEDMHETVHSVQACELLAESAPDDGYLRGFWYGRAQALRELAALTGRAID
jgi:hypothetical protein